ncbi:hypothetical protein RND81_13G016600 [Saponaria officinalis]|uniref:Uncharacterized protein n=1 Tax=Saponaria officinalis TaxID=3572 RepID=A0AAW1GXL2_SAPOF
MEFRRRNPSALSLLIIFSIFSFTSAKLFFEERFDDGLFLTIFYPCFCVIDLSLFVVHECYLMIVLI